MNKAKKEYIKNWLFRANEDLEVLETLSKLNIEKYSSTICFHAQQAVEKYFKAYLVYSDIDFPKTHDLDFLLLECQKKEKKAFESIDLKSLSDFGVFVRYPDDFYVPDSTETQEYVEIAKSVQIIIEELINI